MAGGRHPPRLGQVIPDWGGLPVEPVPVSTDASNDAYAIVPIELNWSTMGGVAYDDPTPQARVTHHPVIHARKGSMGYMLEWARPEPRTASA